MDEKTNEIKRILAVLETLRARKTEQGRAAREWRDGTDAQAFFMSPGVLPVIQKRASNFCFRHRTVMNDSNGATGPEDMVQIAAEKWIRVCEAKGESLIKLATAYTCTISMNAWRDRLDELLAMKRRSDLYTVDVETATNPNPQTGRKGIPLTYDGGSEDVDR